MSVFPAHAGMSRTSLEWREYKIGFPAHAGMSPGTHPAGAHLVSFPRSRGDEPPRVLFFDLAAMFSPLTRG